jgi:hypothetical protein
MAVYCIKNILSEPLSPSDRYVELISVKVEDYKVIFKTVTIKHVEYVIGANGYNVKKVGENKFEVEFPFKEGIVDIMVVGRV